MVFPCQNGAVPERKGDSFVFCSMATVELSGTHVAPPPRILMNCKELCRTVGLCYAPDNIKVGLSKLKSFPTNFAAVRNRTFCIGGKGGVYVG